MLVASAPAGGAGGGAFGSGAGAAGAGAGGSGVVGSAAAMPLKVPAPAATSVAARIAALIGLIARQSTGCGGMPRYLRAIPPGPTRSPWRCPTARACADRPMWEARNVDVPHLDPDAPSLADVVPAVLTALGVTGFQ